MRFLLFIIILLALSVGLGFYMHKDAGYVLISYHHYTIETSLWVAIFVNVVLLVVLLSIFRFSYWASALTTRYAVWRHDRRRRLAEKMMRQGLCRLAQGQWKQAEAYLAKSAKGLSHPMINYLNAAYAAQQLDAHDRRDDYLRQARQSTKNSNVAIFLMQAKLQAESQQYEQALASLKQAVQMQPRNVLALKLLKTVYEALDDWPALIELLPAFKFLRGMTPEKHAALEKRYRLNLLEIHIAEGDAESIQRTWKKLPSIYQFDEDFLIPYLDYFAKTDAIDQLLLLIEQAVKTSWSDRLIATYADIVSVDTLRQIEQMQRWLRRFPQSSVALIGLGKLSARQQLWGQALDYLNQAIKVSDSPKAYVELARVYQAMGENEKALDYYRQGTGHVSTQSRNVRFSPK